MISHFTAVNYLCQRKLKFMKINCVFVEFFGILILIYRCKVYIENVDCFLCCFVQFATVQSCSLYIAY